ncbi:MAG: hypothetical protein IJV43_02700 [Oscillospiraceae bacterium]|nr:hypothetical protein [Oscillospiraceae bacterium]
MRAVKRSLCLILALLMLASLAPERGDAAETVCFTAVNDTLLDLSADTMPFWSGGVLYVPSSAISYGDPPELGIFYSRSRDRSTAVLYKQRSVITFDLVAGTIGTNGSQTYSGSALTRGDAVFLPLDVICRFFGLEYSYTRIAYGYLVRIKSDSVVLSDATFIDAASSPMAQRYSRYERAQQPPAGESSAPAQNTPAQNNTQRTVYFAVESTDVSRTEQLLAYLPSGRATFVFTPQSLEGADELLRRLASGGGAVALRIDASAGADAALAQIEAGNRILWRAASVKTRLVRLEGAVEDTSRLVEDAGYCPIHFALDFGDGSVSVSRMSARTISAADANGGSCSIFLGTDETASGTLSALLVSLRAGNCTPARLNEVVVS